MDERVTNFGSHAVIIKSLPEFFKRIETSLKITGHEYHHRFVDYYDKNKINEKITIFQKPNEFEYQREYRFYLKRYEIIPFSFRIGSLIDIANIFPSEYLTSLRLEKYKA